MLAQSRPTCARIRLNLARVRPTAALFRPKSARIRGSLGQFRTSGFRNAKDFPRITRFRGREAPGEPWRDPPRRAMPAEPMILQTVVGKLHFTTMSALSVLLLATSRNTKPVLHQQPAPNKWTCSFLLGTSGGAFLLGALRKWAGKMDPKSGVGSPETINLSDHGFGHESVPPSRFDAAAANSDIISCRRHRVTSKSDLRPSDLGGISAPLSNGLRARHSAPFDEYW